jgi:hypothetical protein
MDNPTGKRDYIAFLDFVPAAAAGQFGNKWLAINYHGSPLGTGLVALLSVTVCATLAWLLCYFVRTTITKNMQSRGAIIFSSLSVSIGLMLAIVTTTALLSTKNTTSVPDQAAAEPETAPGGAPPQSTADRYDLSTLQILPTSSQTQVFDAAKKGDANALQQVISWANAGDALAQSCLGWMYDVGQGISQDYAQAAQWYRKAADQGNSSAQYNLGVMNQQGHGVPQDFVQAAQWFRKAAERGEVYAQANLGSMYYQGQGVPQDYAQAVHWWRLAAEQGLSAAQASMMGVYGNGVGVPQDYAQAMQWARKAAEQGDATAQYGLGYMYHAGHGIPQDFMQAMTWYIIAKASGSTLPEKNLRTLEAAATPAQIAEAQKAAREWWSAHHPGS